MFESILRTGGADPTREDVTANALEDSL